MSSTADNDNVLRSSSQEHDATTTRSPPHDNSNFGIRGMAEQVTSLLRDSPSELWKAYLLKFLDSYSYFSFSLIFTLFLTEEFGYSDTAAGTIYGMWGALITIYGLAAGCWVDRLGVAKSLQIGFCLTLIARVCILFATTRSALLWQVTLILPAGNCLGIPVLTTGIRRYTTESNRGFAFGLFYVVMNIAGLFSGPVVDWCTILYTTAVTDQVVDQGDAATNAGEQDQQTNDDEEDTTSPPRPWKLSGYRLVILTGVIANVVAVLVAFTVREIKLQPPPPITTTTGEPSSSSLSSSPSSSAAATIAVFAPKTGDVTSILRETLVTRRFWRFLVVCIITLNVRMIFRHLDATLPKYMVREFGPKVAKGTIYSINPAIIILLVPVMTAWTSQQSPLLMIHHGSYVSALSVFVLVLSTSIWSSVVFVTLLSIGEAIWSPRLYDYTMKVCTEGREGTYMALSSAPLFLATLPVGFMSGYLLDQYCPETGDRNSQMMWFIIGITTISSPVFMTVFWKYISYDDDLDNNAIELANVEYSEIPTRIPANKQDRCGSFEEETPPDE
jgi:proton-dependent oligopeptide transporter, POT family